MKKSAVIGFCILAGITALSGCGKNPEDNREIKNNEAASEKMNNEEAQKEMSMEVTNVEASTYVSPDGRVLDKIIYQVSSTDGLEAAPDDFKIEFTIAPVEYLGETESKQTEAEISNVSVENDTVTVEFQPLSYGTIEAAEVECSNNIFNCTLDDFEVLTRTADDFEKNVFTAKDGTELTYFLYMPETTEKVPLMVWEHGGGEVLSSSYEGANLHASRGAVAWIEDGYDTAVLSVQYPENYSFGISEIPDELQQMDAYGTAKYELIQKLISDGSIDDHRIYISGASSGGGAAIRFIMQYPDLFAGALVMSAKDTVIPLSQKYDLAYKFGNNEDLKITEEEYQNSYNEMTEYMSSFDIAATPIWFVHAEHDQICTSYTSVMLYDILEKMGAKNKLTIYSDDEMEAAGQHGSYHGSWAVALEDKEMTSWVYEQKKN